MISQKKGPDAVMVGVLVAALIFGLIGLAWHVLWVVAIIVMALGLGFAVANGRRDRMDVINRTADLEDQRAGGEPSPTAASPSIAPDGGRNPHRSPASQ
jgi:hypothetical protein